jgi:hypothetical protein
MAAPAPFSVCLLCAPICGNPRLERFGEETMKRHLLPPVLLTMLVCIALEATTAAPPSLSRPGTGILNGESRQSQATANVPWSPKTRCALNPTNDKGLHPEALSALRGISVAHRVTQGINNSTARGNVHYTDGMIKGQPYTGAADISVRCLTAEQIKMLLERLAGAGFAAWYRKPGQDDWTGPSHIHAVWAGCLLKPVLQQQVRSWLDGKNGLASNRPYQFWQPSDHVKEKVHALYRASNQ